MPSTLADQWRLGLANSYKKLFRGRRNRWNWFGPAEFRLFRGTENSRNSVLSHSAEQKSLRIPIRTIRQRRKMLGIPFRGKKFKQTLEFHSEACLGQKHAVYSVCWSRIFYKTNFFFVPLSSVPSLGIDSSINLGMPQNEHFLPRNNGSHSESIPRIFSVRNFIASPTNALVYEPKWGGGGGGGGWGGSGH
jgi:hypothetical protein